MRTLIGVGETRKGVNYFKHTPSRQVNVVNTTCLWYRPLGHPPSEVLSLLSSSLCIVCDSNKRKEEVCEICLHAKQTRNPFPISVNIIKDMVDLIHCDIWGPYTVPSTCGAHYFLSTVDDATRATWVYLMCDRTEASKLLQHFIIMVKNLFGKGVKVVRSDNGNEFISRPMQQFYHEQGILCESCLLYTSPSPRDGLLSRMPSSA